MKPIRIIWFIIALCVCCGSCSKDDSVADNLLVINVDKSDGPVNASVYSLADRTYPILELGNGFSNRVSAHLNIGDYQIRSTKGSIPTNFQIQVGRRTEIRYQNRAVEVTYR